MDNIEYHAALLQAATRYAACGFRVLPLSPFSKIPRFKDWPWQEAASNDVRYIQDWWTQWPDSNIALVVDDRTIVDIDRKPGKTDGWIQVGAAVDQETPWAATPNGGFHFFYQTPDVPLRSVPGVDLLQGARYIAAAPSRIYSPANGGTVGQYHWGRELGPVWDSGIKPMPGKLIDLLRGEEGYDEGDAEFPGLLPDSIPHMPRDKLKEAHREFLKTGLAVGFPSRSEVVQSLATRLYQLGYDDAQVLSMLWNEDWVQSTAQEHRKSYERALEDWLWNGLKKLRHHRPKAAQEVFKRQDTTPQDDLFKSLRDTILRLEPTADIKPILQQMAAARFMPVDEDDLVTALCSTTGRKKGVLVKSLAKLRADLIEVRATEGAIPWKHVTGGDNPRPLPTVENLEVLLAHKGATVHHNLMTHRIEVYKEGMTWGTEEQLNNQLTAVRSWAAEFQLPMDPVGEQLVMISRQHEYHPFRSWVEAVPWDGIPRLAKLYRTIRVPEGKEEIKKELLKPWLISVIASVWGYGNRAPRGVLTFVGPQQIGKTTWLRYLVPDGMYRQGLILRADQRDSATTGLRTLIAEIGEVGTTFRRQDIESLKTYIGAREDRYRLPYARDESTWQRRTVFAASANDPEILHDQSGNTRWWVVPVTGFDLDTMEQVWGGGNGQELHQLWAEVLRLYYRGEPWDLTDEQLKYLEEHQEAHKEYSPVEVLLRDTYAWQSPRPKHGYPIPRREKDIAREMGWGRPMTPMESRQLRAALRTLTGQQQATKRRVTLVTEDGKKVDSEGADKRIQGRWWMTPPLLT